MLVIIGGTGFIARHLCVSLQARRIAAATVSFNPSLNFLREWAPSVRGIELGTPDARAAFAEATVAIHLAHRSRPSSYLHAPHLEIESNVVESVGIIQEILSVNPHCHIVYASSGGQIYGRGHSAPISEVEPAAPTTTYGLGKHLIEQAIAYFERSVATSATILRIANPVGRWQLDRAHGLVAAAVRSARTGDPLTIFGDGLNYRDYFDVEDLADLLAGFSDPTRRLPGTFNIGSGVGMTERDVLAMVERVLGTSVPHRSAPARPFDLRYAVLDTGKASDNLGWSASIPLEETIAKIDRALGDVRTRAGKLT